MGEMFGRSVRETLFQYSATVASPQQASRKAALKVSSEGGRRDRSRLSLKIHCLLHGSHVFKLLHFVLFQNAVLQDTQWVSKAIIFWKFWGCGVQTVGLNQIAALQSEAALFSCPSLWQKIWNKHLQVLAISNHSCRSFFWLSHRGPVGRWNSKHIEQRILFHGGQKRRRKGGREESRKTEWGAER